MTSYDVLGIVFLMCLQTSYDVPGNVLPVYLDDIIKNMMSFGKVLPNCLQDVIIYYVIRKVLPVILP